MSCYRCAEKFSLFKKEVSLKNNQSFDSLKLSTVS